MTDLRVSVAYIGGVAVYVNGEEIGRSELPTDALEAYTPATKYPIEAYTTEDGKTALPRLTTEARNPDPKLLSRYQTRVRT